MTCAHDTHHHSFPALPNEPSPDLQDRAADGLARFLARWEDPGPDPERTADSTGTQAR